MIRIMGDRATGKTMQLLFQAEQLARKHPNETIYFVGNHALKQSYGSKVAKNIKFVTPMAFWNMRTTPSDYVVIDEIESFLGGLGVRAYNLTLADRRFMEE